MGKLKLYDIPYFDTFFQYVTHLSKYGDKVGICQYDRKGNLTAHTYGELAADALGLARVLRARGLEGAHIAVAGENSYEWLAALLGITSAGAVAVPIDIEQSDDTIRTMDIFSKVPNSPKPAALTNTATVGCSFFRSVS